MIMQYGLLGGTFDPVHFGHLSLAETAREEFGLDKVFLVPAGNPPHKPGRVIASAEDRFRLVEMAAADNPRFVVSRVEIDRPGPSYTLDTFDRLYKDNPGSWALIVGADTLAEIPTWYRFAELMSRVCVIAASRPGSALTVPDELRPWSERIRFFHPPALEISSSMVRSRLQKGLSVRYLMPAEVVSFLAGSGLYRNRV